MKDGESAFPSVMGDVGMTLRDYFAGQALEAFAIDYFNMKQQLNRADLIIAENAYKLADAMLAEREKRNGKDSC